QFKPEFLKISPNNRIPAIVDRDTGSSLMESGAILIYLADKTGKLLPKQGEPRYRVIEWLMWQMGGPGPMLGHVHHFVTYNKGKAPYAEERYLKEAHRLYGVLDRRLADCEFVADAYSIADIAIWPWISRFEWQTIDLNQYPNVMRWYVTIANRPAVQRGYVVPKKVNELPMPGRTPWCRGPATRSPSPRRAGRGRIPSELLRGGVAARLSVWIGPLTRLASRKSARKSTSPRKRGEVTERAAGPVQQTIAVHENRSPGAADRGGGAVHVEH